MFDHCHTRLEAPDGRTTPCGQPVVGTITTRDHEGFKDTHHVCATCMTTAMEA